MVVSVRRLMVIWYPSLKMYTRNIKVGVYLVELRMATWQDGKRFVDWLFPMMGGRNVKTDL